MDSRKIEDGYGRARERYAGKNVDTDCILDGLKDISLSLHCWQGDDVAGFETPDTALKGSGLCVTGSYPGRARNIGELRADLEKAFSLIPGRHSLNLHAIYGEFGGRRVDRDAVGPEHFAGWVEWAVKHDLKLDFNSTCFSHPMAESGFTLSSKDPGIRHFWIEHVRRCRSISAFLGRSLHSPCLHNLWIPDGSKDDPVDRWGHRSILKDSLDEVYSVRHKPEEMQDSVESKLFGIGSESYVVGSHEFYLGYALTRGLIPCFDLGHFHPTESVADKISSVLQFAEGLLLHFSRGVRWDSDHVVILNDEVKVLASEVVRSGGLDRVRLALDFFDAELNRVGAWVVGARAVLKAFLCALLEPGSALLAAEESGDRFSRLALLEEMKAFPWGDVWEYFCLRAGVPGDEGMRAEILSYDGEMARRRT